MTWTTRQLEVMVEIATGDTYEEIGHRLGMSEQTVKNHAHEARRRIEAASNVDAFRKMGWLIVPKLTEY